MKAFLKCMNNPPLLSAVKIETSTKSHLRKQIDYRKKKQYFLE